MISFLKNLFGGSSSTTPPQAVRPSQLNSAVKTVTTTSTQVELTFNSDVKFFPCFTNYRLEGSAVGGLVKPFHYTMEGELAVLVLLVQKDASDVHSEDERTYHLIDTSTIEEDIYLALMESASKSLAQEPAFFSFVEDSNGTMLIGHGSDFACEMIMCEAHMRKAHEMLKAEQILVSVARQGLMLVGVYSENEEESKSFYKMHWAIWKGLKAADRKQISEDVFVMKNGEIERVVYMNQ